MHKCFCGFIAVPVVPRDSQGVPNYFGVVDHQPGQLYALRIADNHTILRTLESNAMTPFGKANIGIQDAARGVYRCVAINGLMEVNTTVRVEPTGGF